MPVERTEEETLEQIALLLRKAERTENPEEAKTFEAAAEAKMIRLGIDRARVEAAARAEGRSVADEPIVVHKILFEDGNCLIEARFFAWIANAFDLRTIIFARRTRGGRGSVDASYRGLSIFGHASDVERAVRIAQSLRAQATTAVAHWERTDPEIRMLKLVDGRKVPALRRHFIMAFASEAANRIAENRKEQVNEVKGTGTDLVLADRKTAVDRYVADHHPKLGKARAPRVSEYADAAGRKAARDADIGSDALAGRRALEG
jgi:hypothetical protein